MGELSSETGMRFQKLTDMYGIKLIWLTDNEKNHISKWSWRGPKAQERCDEKLSQIGMVAGDGYTVHSYELENRKWKFKSTSLSCTIKPNEELEYDT